MRLCQGHFPSAQNLNRLSRSVSVVLAPWDLAGQWVGTGEDVLSQ